ncbi:L-tyrosine:2-oxoglutarate aminotransferase [Coniophora puteana RWD-64-598 SS2]|uniref:L-tyrosine:2-oxoglutarate aminotransferase n=1 Tax=Coniophora puteana (strain RWD-64-598) TaxID=741705 RepID=R7SGI7_CONPW|nr:L-tyrosine:2-oxoglutarate aminotransferase [Coniophora puteana RWD-64-598 SS2]EIW74179.1 L-tyrosine:2-oxoglutarate aminotransferase [Coniophora puteana RWD-64-598 SS2]
MPVAVESAIPYPTPRKVDLAHHLSTEARIRQPNPIKSVWKAAQIRPGIINMGNGDPHHTLYPIASMNFIVPSLDGDHPVEAWRMGTSKTLVLSSHKDAPSTLSLRTAFAYGAGAGLPAVREALADLGARIHAPPNHTVCLSLGNADALTKCFRLFGDPDDSFLCEEFTFSAMTNAALALGIRWVPVRVDGGGLLPEDLERVMRCWDEKKQGKRPHVLYTVPCSQNPTGSTISLERRRQIYEVAHIYDIIIIEDDPYYFLQYDLQINQNTLKEHGYTRAMSEVLPRSFLSMDIDGRVVRLDSFSKVLAPGIRLGWITSSPFFADKLDMLTDSSTQHPHGLGQAYLAELLGPTGWGADGLMKWVHSLAREYERRRDLFVSVFDAKVAPTGCASAEVPQSGMFVWIQVHLESHPRFVVRTPDSGSDDEGDMLGAVMAAPGVLGEVARRGPITNTEQLMSELLRKLVESGVIMIPASTFAIVDRSGSTLSPIGDRANYLRATFVGTDETIRDGLTIFAQALEEFFNLK